MSAFRRSRNSKRSTESTPGVLQLVSAVSVLFLMFLWQRYRRGYKFTPRQSRRCLINNRPTWLLRRAVRGRPGLRARPCSAGDTACFSVPSIPHPSLSSSASRHGCVSGNQQTEERSMLRLDPHHPPAVLASSCHHFPQISALP